MDADLKKILKPITLELRHLLEGRYDSAGKWQPGDLEQRLAAIGIRRDRASVPVDETLRKYRVRIKDEGGRRKDESDPSFIPDPSSLFTAPDALGWPYQYWNTEEKDRVFEKVRTVKGAKIAGADVIPATQLYTVGATRHAAEAVMRREGEKSPVSSPPRAATAPHSHPRRLLVTRHSTLHGGDS